jgi:DNA-binding CsgD family transcriptional regulator
MELGAEASEVREKIIDRRGSPGVLVLSAACTVLYMNRQARELICDMKNGSVPGARTGELPAIIHEVCRELCAIDGDPLHRTNREQIEVRRLAEGRPLPVIVRGLLLSGITGDQQGAVIILEAVGRRETMALRMNEAFGLTDREQMVVHTLARGSTNKEIAYELSITVPTVKAHMKHIMAKTKCSTRTGILAQVLCPSAFPVLQREGLRQAGI